MRIEIASYDHADAQPLIAAIQQEYVVRYGEADRSAIDINDFLLPRGVFLLGYLDGAAVASGAWRAREEDGRGCQDGDAELKRMYVVPSARGYGFARTILAELERTASEAGRRRVVLETGTAQPEAICLYESSGYYPIPKFGAYRAEPSSRCFAKIL